MLTFWDTVRGVQLADTLIRELPKLTKSSSRQYLIETGSYAEAIVSLKDVYANTDDKVVQVLSDTETGAVTLVMEAGE